LLGHEDCKITAARKTYELKLASVAKLQHEFNKHSKCYSVSDINTQSTKSFSDAAIEVIQALGDSSRSLRQSTASKNCIIDSIEKKVLSSPDPKEVFVLNKPDVYQQKCTIKDLMDAVETLPNLSCNLQKSGHLYQSSHFDLHNHPNYHWLKEAVEIQNILGDENIPSR
jgi:hypothetical protein